MVNKCVAAGCSNVSSAHVSLFKFPTDPLLRRQWEKQVQRTRADWKATEHSHLCSEHFTSDCFEYDTAIAATFGMKKRKRLKPGAIPTIFIRQNITATSKGDGGTSSRKRSATTLGTSETTRRKRGAFEKRERSRVSVRLLEV